MTQRIEYRSPLEGSLVEDLADGRQARTLLRGRELRQAHMRLAAEAEVERAQAELVEQVARAAAPQPRAPYHNPGVVLGRMHERLLDGPLRQPLNSNTADLARAGLLSPDQAQALRPATGHPELEPRR